MVYDHDQYIESQTLDGWITLNGAARLLGVGYFTARRRIQTKWKLNTKRISDQIFVKISDVQDAQVKYEGR